MNDRRYILWPYEVCDWLVISFIVKILLRIFIISGLDLDLNFCKFYRGIVIYYNSILTSARRQPY